MNKHPKMFRLSSEATVALESEAQRTGKTMTAVIEDALLWRRQFGDEAEAAVNALSERHGIPARKVVEFAVLKAAGTGISNLPFNHLAAA